MHAVFKMNGRLYHLEPLQGLWPSMLCSDSSDTFPRSTELWKWMILWRLLLSWISPLPTIIFKAWILKDSLELFFFPHSSYISFLCPVSLWHRSALAQSPRAGRRATEYARGSLKFTRVQRCHHSPMQIRPTPASRAPGSQVISPGEDLISLQNPGNWSCSPPFYMLKITTILAESPVQKAIFTASEKHFASKFFLLICMHFYK